MSFSKSVAVRNAARRRQILITALGGECVQCGSCDCLEFHHKEPRDWVASELSRWSRQTQYEIDWEHGLLELLCSDCNKRAGVPVSEKDLQEAPF